MRRTLEEKFAAKLKDRLEEMGALNKESTVLEVRQVNGRWRGFAAEVEAYVAEDIMSAETPQTYFAEHVWCTDQWKNFERLRSTWKQRRPDIRQKRHKRDNKRYKDKLKAERSTPEAKAILAERKRQERARKRAQEAAHG